MTKNKFFSRILPLFFVAAVILWLSLAPSPPNPPRFLSWDKVQHALAYAFLTVLAGRFFIYLYRSSVKGWFAGAFFSFLYGALIEIFQGVMTSHRNADIKDVVANLVGILSVLSVVALWNVIFRRDE